VQPEEGVHETLEHFKPILIKELILRMYEKSKGPNIPASQSPWDGGMVSYFFTSNLQTIMKQFPQSIEKMMSTKDTFHLFLAPF
jgi:hypothetical protein